MRKQINKIDGFDEAFQYFEGFAHKKRIAWICPADGDPVSAEMCLTMYLDALDEIDLEPDHKCLQCNLAPVLKEKISKSDNVSHPEHYTSHPSGIECIDIARHHDFCTGNAIKYIWRHGLKGGSRDKKIEDLKKAIKYLEFAVDGEIKGAA